MSSEAAATEMAVLQVEAASILTITTSAPVIIDRSRALAPIPDRLTVGDALTMHEGFWASLPTPTKTKTKWMRRLCWYLMGATVNVIMAIFIQQFPPSPNTKDKVSFLNDTSSFISMICCLMARYIKKRFTRQNQDGGCYCPKFFMVLWAVSFASAFGIFAAVFYDLV